MEAIPSSGNPQIRLRYGPGLTGIERMEAVFESGGFAPHRHDRYAIGITLQGVQSFRYRGTSYAGLPGEGHILHPDELHDGISGTADGLRYRIVYIDPALIQEAIGGNTLPFVPDPVVARAAVASSLTAALRDLDDPLTELEGVDLIAELADGLLASSSPRRGHRTPLAVEAVSAIRRLIIDDPITQHPAAEYEAITGLTRWEIARQFRAAFGTSPTQFRTMRRLDRARRMLRDGRPPATVASETGFADQSHFTRMFRRTYGLSPAVWATAAGEPDVLDAPSAHPI